jgi:hypothetical protein
MINLLFVAPIGSRLQPLDVPIEDTQSSAIPGVGDSVYIDGRICEITKRTFAFYDEGIHISFDTAT